MPRYDFECRAGHRREYVLPMDRRDDPVRDRCPECKGEMKRVFSAPAIKGEHESKTFYEHEREAWRMATGQGHNDARELETWCKENGKQIVPKGYKPPKPEAFSEKEALDTLDAIYRENHDLGSIGGC